MTLRPFSQYAYHLFLRATGDKLNRESGKKSRALPPRVGADDDETGDEERGGRVTS